MYRRRLTSLSAGVFVPTNHEGQHMSDAKTEGGAAGGAAAADTGAADAAKAAADAKAAEAAKATADAAKAKADAKAEPPKPATKKKTDDDGAADVDDFEDRFEISQKALNARLARASSKALKEAFGTDDVEKIKKTIKEHEELKAKDEETKRAALSEKERLEADLKTAREEKTALEAKLVAMEEATTIDKQERAIRVVAKEYADPKYVRVAMTDFAEHVEAMSDKEAEKFGPDDAKKWFEGWAKDNPKLAKDAGDGDDKAKTKTPITTGHAGGKPPPPASGGGEKKVKDMSLKEVRERAASMGVKYPT